MNRLPISVIAQSGMLSKKPQSSIALIISFGRVVLPVLVIPDDVIILLVTPWIIWNIAIISSSPYVTTPFDMANLRNSLRACSGRLTSSRLELVFIIPTRKNRTTSASPIACMAPFTVRITFHMPPPLKLAGEIVSSFQTSASLSFQVSSVLIRC